jgi:hypothetical protein
VGRVWWGSRCHLGSWPICEPSLGLYRRVKRHKRQKMLKNREGENKNERKKERRNTTYRLTLKAHAWNSGCHGLP